MASKKNAAQTALPLSIPEAPSLNAKAALNLKALPFAICVQVTEPEEPPFNVLLQLQVSPAFVSKKLPCWSKATSYKMFCWRQAPPVTAPASSPRNDYWLLQFSTSAAPVLSFFLVQDKSRKPVAPFKDHFFERRIATPFSHFVS